jgi:hypothetical protein
MSRLRNRPDRFTFKGDPYAFHRIQDGATLGRLDPYASTEQRWLLHSGRVLMVTGSDVRDITEQVHGIKLPNTRPTGDWDEDRIAAIEENIRLLFQLVGAQVKPPEPDAYDLARADIARLQEEQRTRVFIDDLAEPEPLPVQEPEPVVDDLLAWDGGNNIGTVTPDALLSQLGTNLSSVVDEIAGMSSGDRTHFTEKLNEELAELQQKRGKAGEDLARERSIEALLNLFARVGEKM